jgi:acetolactate synthase-1/2/3 large subunit
MYVIGAILALESPCITPGVDRSRPGRVACAAMHPAHPVQSQPATAAEAYVGLLAARGVEYLFANGGTDFAPVVEAYARGKGLGWRMPEPVIVPHENMGVAMAHGHTMVSGRAQAMMVHVGMGTANAVNGLINAARMNIPMLFTAGRTPLTESGAVPGARNNYIHWAQEHFDQGAMLREFMKWDYELRHPEQVETAVDRALAIARSEPQGPVYLTLPREILAAPFGGRTSPAATQAAASAPAADPDALEEAARLLGRAERPLLITANAGKTDESAQAIAQLSETFGVPVVHYRPRYFALSTEHPMHAGWEPHARLKEADLVLVVECDVPWIPQQGGPHAQAKVIHIGPDPLYARYPLRGFRTDIALAGLTAPTLRRLAERALAHAPAAAKLKARFAALEQQLAAARAGQRGASQAMSARYASACVNRLIDAHTLVVNEYPLVLEELQLRERCRYYASAPAGGLGWGLGAALGAKLAAPDKTVICCVGDGAYMFGNPTASHFVSEAMKLPVLFVVFNNARWAAVHRATLALYPKGAAAGMAQPPFATLEPSPRFEKTIEASGGYGARVDGAEDLMPALEKALRVVKEEKRQALVNLRLEASYVKTS